MLKNSLKHIARLMHQADPHASFAFEFWDGDDIRFGDRPRVTLCLNSKNCANWILTKGFLGFGEAYVVGDLEVEGDLPELLRLGLAINFDRQSLPLRYKVLNCLQALLQRSTEKCAPSNIAFHYDLGDEFYAQYLDPTMTYSCAYFCSPEDSLEKAQLNKYDHIARKLLLQPNETLLDIGCGWGGMVIYAAEQYGMRAAGNTLSKNQYTYAKRMVKQRGLEDRVTVLYKDYRQLLGKFDKIVSIGMFEHVGKEYSPVFFRKVAELLKLGGLGLLHTIGKDAASRSDPWTRKYIFPGSYLPTLSEISRGLSRIGCSVLDVENLRLHYAQTLVKWADRFERNRERVKELYDERLVRRWRLFLNSAMVGFRHGESRLYQVLFSHGLNNALPITRDHLYRA